MRCPSDSARPSTVSGIKRLAKAIRRDNAVSYSTALDLAAQECGYENFHHGRRALQRLSSESPAIQRSYSIYLSIYWRDQTKQPREGGLETLKIELASPLRSILQKHQVNWARGLEGYFIEYEDHLEMRGDVDSQVRARELLYRAALSLQFMDATGLRPATTRAQREKMQVVEGLPHRDHISRWLAPSGQCVILDEPYGHVTKEDAVKLRAAWLDRHGLHMARPAWSGLYVPGESVPHLISADTELLDQIARTVEALPTDSSSTLREWQGISGDYFSQFVSPARQAAGAKRKPRPGTTYGWSKNAITYFQRPGYQPRRRPDQAMSLADHVALGKL